MAGMSAVGIAYLDFDGEKAPQVHTVRIGNDRTETHANFPGIISLRGDRDHGIPAELARHAG